MRDQNSLNYINHYREVLRKSASRVPDDQLPDNASFGYRRQMITSVEEEAKLAQAPSRIHKNESCQIFGSKVCKECDRFRKSQIVFSKNPNYGILPEMSQRYLCAPNILIGMMNYGGYKPVIPLYHHTSSEEKNAYYCSWVDTLQCRVDIPVLTKHELYQRSRLAKAANQSPNTTNVDKLPPIDRELTSSLDAPTNSPLPVQTDSLIGPPIIDWWRNWRDHHKH